MNLLKLVSLLMTIVLIFGVLVSCDGKADIADNSRDNNSSTVFGLAPPKATVTIYVNSLRKGHEEVAKEIEKRTKQFLNIELIFKEIPNYAYENEIEELFESGEDFDAIVVYDMPSRSAPSKNHLMYLAQKGYLADITEIFPQNAPNTYYRFSGEELAQVSYRGKIMGIPYNIPMSTRQCVYIRKSLVEKYKVKDIKTLNDYEEFLKTIAGKEPDFNLYQKISTENYIDQYGYVNIGGHIVYRKDDPEMRLVPWEQTPEFREAVEAVKRIYELNQLNTGGEIRKKNASWIFEMKYFNLPPTSSRLEGDLNNEPVDEIWQAFPLDYKYKNMKYPVTGYVMVFNKKSENIDRVIKLVEWVYADQSNYNLMKYGIEGRDYTLDDGFITYTSEGHYYGEDFFRDIEKDIYTKIVPRDYKKFYLQAVEENSQYVPHAGFMPSIDIISFQRERLFRFTSKYQGSGHNHRPEGTPLNFNMDLFIQNEREMGIDLIVEKLQLQLDEWKRQRESNN